MYLFELEFSPDICPGVGLQDHMVALFLVSFFKINLFIYFWLCWVFVAVRGLSLVVASRAALHCGARASHCGGLSCCRARALGMRDRKSVV